MSEKRIKDWFLSQSLDHPKRTTIITLLISILMGSGLQFFKIEDDMMKMIPGSVISVIPVVGDGIDEVLSQSADFIDAIPI